VEIVDGHLHFWDLTRFDYPWITPTNPVLYQNRLPDDVRPLMLASGVSRAVLVQAAGTPEEIPWMLELCNAYPYIAGVVGYVDLTSRRASIMLSGFARDPRFKGVRVNLPVNPRLRPALDESLLSLERLELSCDLLMSFSQLPQALDLIREHPGTRFILDHFVGFRLKLGGENEFASALHSLSGLQNTAVKMSGYLTANDDTPRVSLAHTLRGYIKAAIDVLGADRLMFGSDWPVCTLAGGYGDTVDALRNATASLTPTQVVSISSATAIDYYRL